MSNTLRVRDVTKAVRRVLGIEWPKEIRKRDPNAVWQICQGANYEHWHNAEILMQLSMRATGKRFGDGELFVRGETSIPSNGKKRRLDWAVCSDGLGSGLASPKHVVMAGEVKVVSCWGNDENFLNDQIGRLADQLRGAKEIAGLFGTLVLACKNREMRGEWGDLVEYTLRNRDRAIQYLKKELGTFRASDFQFVVRPSERNDRYSMAILSIERRGRRWVALPVPGKFQWTA